MDCRSARWRSCAAALVMLSGGVAVGSVTAAVSSFGVVPTRACLERKGAVVAPSDPVVAALAAGVRSKVIAATVSGGAVSGPAFAYVVLGRDAAEARAIRARIGRLLTFPATGANSLSGVSGNAAWLIESTVGTRPPAALGRLVSGCLRAGVVPSGPAPLTRVSVSRCVGLHSGDVIDRRMFAISYPGVSVPDRLWNRMVASFVTDGKGAQYGIIGYVFFGDSGSSAASLRQSFLSLVGGPFDGQVQGQRRSVAWLSAPSRKATVAEAAAATRVFHSCLE